MTEVRVGVFCTAARRDCVGGAAHPRHRALDKGVRQGSADKYS